MFVGGRGARRGASKERRICWWRRSRPVCDCHTNFTRHTDDTYVRVYEHVDVNVSMSVIYAHMNLGTYVCMYTSIHEPILCTCVYVCI